MKLFVDFLHLKNQTFFSCREWLWGYLRNLAENFCWNHQVKLPEFPYFRKLTKNPKNNLWKNCAICFVLFNAFTVFITNFYKELKEKVSSWLLERKN